MPTYQITRADGQATIEAVDDAAAIVVARAPSLPAEPNQYSVTTRDAREPSGIRLVDEGVVP